MTREPAPAHYAKALEFAHQAPVMIALISSPIQGHKIPVWEQELSCGAVAMNLLHAAHALGYVGGWITGWQAYSPRVTEPSARRASGSQVSSFLERRPTRWKNVRGQRSPTMSANGSRPKMIESSRGKPRALSGY